MIDKNEKKQPVKFTSKLIYGDNLYEQVYNPKRKRSNSIFNFLLGFQRIPDAVLGISLSG